MVEIAVIPSGLGNPIPCPASCLPHFPKEAWLDLKLPDSWVMESSPLRLPFRLRQLIISTLSEQTRLSRGVGNRPFVLNSQLIQIDLGRYSMIPAARVISTLYGYLSQSLIV